MGERHHVASALDQRVLRVRHVPPDDVADGVVDDRRLRSLDDVDRRGHRGERVSCDPVVEQNVPQISPAPLDSKEPLTARARPPSGRAGSVVEVDEFLEGLVPPPRPNVRAPPIAQSADLGLGAGVLRPQQPVCLRLDDGERVHQLGAAAATRSAVAPPHENPTRHMDAPTCSARRKPDRHSRRGSGARPRLSRCRRGRPRSRRAGSPPARARTQASTRRRCPPRCGGTRPASPRRARRP